MRSCCVANHQADLQIQLLYSGIKKTFSNQTDNMSTTHKCKKILNTTHCMFCPRLERGDPFLHRQSACLLLILLSLIQKDPACRTQLSRMVPDKKTLQHNNHILAPVLSICGKYSYSINNFSFSDIRYHFVSIQKDRFR